MIYLAEQIKKQVTSVEPEKVSEAIANTPIFSKAQLIGSEKYAQRRDALNALLNDRERYSSAQVDEILKKFDEGGKK